MAQIKRAQSRKLFAEACSLMVGGVNSPVRAFQSVGGTPVIFKRGQGPFLYDVDGNRYVDFCLSWGALILGHSHPLMRRALNAQAKLGTSFGACQPGEIALAKLIRKAFPSCERLRLVNSGTEAAMTAIRLARGYTGKTQIIKFEGCYHGHVDSLLVKAGSGLATSGIATSKGIPPETVQQTRVLPFNDIQALKKTFEQTSDIAAVVVEPVPGNMGVILPQPEFLKELGSLTKKHGTVFILDEVISGFRVSRGGAQALLGIEPDLTLLGKIIGGGLPVGALGGKKTLMNLLAPEGPVYQAGTLSGNPLACAVGSAVLAFMQEKRYQSLNRLTRDFVRDLKAVFDRINVPVSIPCAGSMFSVFFMQKSPERFSDITAGHVETYRKFFNHMLNSGVYLPPSAYEAWFLSTEHDRGVLKNVLRGVERFKP